MSESPRIAVFAYSDVGHACLSLLLERGANVVAVFTHEDNPNEQQWFPSVAQLAEGADLQVFKPEKLRRVDWEARIREEIRPDLVLSFYYRNMIPSWLLAVPPLGAFNMHGSYLPRYRGRAPVNWAVLHGETQTGATLHVMVKEPDAGDIVDQEAVPIGPDDPAIAVMQRVKQAAVTVLGRQLDALLAGTAPRQPQNEAEATYFGGRKPEDGRIDWSRPAKEVHNLIRAVTHPYPGAFTDEIEEGRLLVWRSRVVDGASSAAPGTVVSREPFTIACGEGCLELLEFEWM